MLAFSVAREEEIIFGLDWNSLGMLAIGSTEWKVIIKKFDTDSMNFVDFATVQTSSSCRCLTWNNK